MDRPESNSEWREKIRPVIDEFKKEPVGISIFLVLSFLYLLGFVYNNFQNESELFSLEWFYDSVILSWTNLLILPILLLSVPWQAHERDWSTFKVYVKLHLYSPLIWILGYIAVRFINKVLNELNGLVINFLNWLAS